MAKRGAVDYRRDHDPLLWLRKQIRASNRYSEIARFHSLQFLEKVRKQTGSSIQQLAVAQTAILAYAEVTHLTAKILTLTEGSEAYDDTAQQLMRWQERLVKNLRASALSIEKPNGKAKNTRGTVFSPSRNRRPSELRAEAVL